jgi:hypothetical protein
MSSYNCFYHPNLPSVAVCSRCGRAICASCSKPYGALTICPNCYHSLPSAQMVPPPIVNASPGPVQPGWYGPYAHFTGFFRSSWLPVILVGVAAALILLNAGALLSPAFASIWGSLLPWLPSLGAISFILGVILGIVLLGALVLILLNFRLMAAFVIFPTALVSLLIGGGFGFGAILAVIAGILLLL